MADRLPALGPRGEGWVLLQLALIGLIAVLGALNLPATVARWPTGWPFVAQGIGIMLIGGSAAWQGLRSLGSANLTALPRPPQEGSLTQAGIYARIRHPIYLGVMALGLGWALATLSFPALLAALALAVVLDLKSRREEVWLIERYPEYGAYRARTNRFIPGVY